MEFSIRTSRCRRLAPALCIWLLCMLAPLPGLFAQSETPRSDRIDIRSDRLSIDNEKRVAEFSGHVTARQAETIIEADRLSVYYREGAGKSVDALEKIVATGNVRIRFENGLAETPEAVYNVKSRVFVLTGAGSRVTSGSSHIVGEKITLRRKEGQVTVEGGRSSQVEAVFYPENEKKQSKKSGQPPAENSRTEATPPDR